MAYKTFTAGSVLTASDIMTYLMKQVVITCTSGSRPASPTEGMTIYETDTDYMRIYDGGSWRVVSGLTPKARAERNTTQTVSNTTATAVSFNVENYDVGGCWTAGNSTRMTAPIAGAYLVTGAIEFSANGTGTRHIQIWQNGAEVIRHTATNIGSGTATRVAAAYVARLSAGDYMEIAAYQDSGGSLSLSNGGDMPCMTFTWLSEG